MKKPQGANAEGLESTARRTPLISRLIKSLWRTGDDPGLWAFIPTLIRISSATCQSTLRGIVGSALRCDS